MIRLPGLKGIWTGFDESSVYSYTGSFFQLPAVLVRSISWVISVRRPPFQRSQRGYIHRFDSLSGHSVNSPPRHGQNKIIDLLRHGRLILHASSLPATPLLSKLLGISKMPLRFKHPLEPSHGSRNIRRTPAHRQSAHTYQNNFFITLLRSMLI